MNQFRNDIDPDHDEEDRKSGEEDDNILNDLCGFTDTREEEQEIQNQIKMMKKIEK